MSDYDDGWNEGFDLGARKVKELQAENAKLKEPAAAFRYACPICRNSSGHKMDCQNRAYVAQLEAENAELQSKIDTAIEQLNEHIHEDKHHLDDILFDLEGGADSIKLELCDEQN